MGVTASRTIGPTRRIMYGRYSHVESVCKFKITNVLVLLRLFMGPISKQINSTRELEHQIARQSRSSLERPWPWSMNRYSWMESEYIHLWSVYQVQISIFNHVDSTRTAVLIILEYLASVGILYTRDPIRIYWILAQRETENDMYDPKDAVRDVVKEVGDSNYRPNEGITDEQRQKYAQQVKNTKMVWGRIKDITERVQHAPLGAERRKVVQEEKQKDPHLYELYVEATHIT